MPLAVKLILWVYMLAALWGGGYAMYEWKKDFGKLSFMEAVVCFFGGLGITLFYLGGASIVFGACSFIIYQTFWN